MTNERAIALFAATLVLAGCGAPLDRSGEGAKSGSVGTTLTLGPGDVQSVRLDCAEEAGCDFKIDVTLEGDIRFVAKSGEPYGDGERWLVGTLSLAPETNQSADAHDEHALLMDSESLSGAATYEFAGKARGPYELILVGSDLPADLASVSVTVAVSWTPVHVEPSLPEERLRTLRAGDVHTWSVTIPDDASTRYRHLTVRADEYYPYTLLDDDALELEVHNAESGESCSATALPGIAMCVIDFPVGTYDIYVSGAAADKIVYSLSTTLRPLPPRP